jgi:phospholipid/cholesterol/gamma-HCH transport system permease protein
MPLAIVEKVGRDTSNLLAAFGDFWIFAGQMFRWLFSHGWRGRGLKLMLPLAYEIGTKSVPVVAITGAFIGMVMAVESFNQFRVVGQEERLGGIIGLIVLKQIGPVLAAVMLAGRVGGALTAELGTMNVTEQLDALRVMGSDPIRYLVVPRFLVCLLLTPILTVYSNLLGVVGGWLVSTHFLGVPNEPYWRFSASMIGNYQIFEGLAKSFLFGGAIGLISCYKGFTCGAGASGVGRACTDSFVTSFLAIICINLFTAKLLQDLYIALYGMVGVFDA